MQSLDNFQLNEIEFSGPFRLLLELVREQKVDIEKVDLIVVIDQYLQIVRESDLKLHAEYASIAAWLIAIKCRKLLPIEENDETEEQLRQKLIKYEQYTNLSQKLKQMLKDQKIPIYKEENIISNYQSDLELINEGDIDSLTNCLWLIIERELTSKSFDSSLATSEEITTKDVKQVIIQYFKIGQQRDFIKFLKTYQVNFIIIAFMELLSMISKKEMKIIELTEKSIILERVKND